MSLFHQFIFLENRLVFQGFHISLLEKSFHKNNLRKETKNALPSSKIATTTPFPDMPRAQTGKTLMSSPGGPLDCPILFYKILH